MLTPKQLLQRLKNNNTTILLLLGIFALFYATGLDKIPHGFFADEAVIGVVSYEILHGNFTNLVNPFFYHHFHYIFGSLPVLSTVPFILLFGLNEYAIRFTSVFFALLSFFVFYRILRLLKMKNVLLAVIFFATIPLFFHLSRIGFGQLPAFFLLLLGYYWYLKSKNILWLAILSGVCFGISLYGNAQFTIITPLFCSTLWTTALLQNRQHYTKYKRILFLTITLCVLSLPLLFTATTNEQFFNRIRDKQEKPTLFSPERFFTLAQNYPKYFSLHYLFQKGEADMPGAFVTRHSVTGNGLLLWSSLPFILGGYYFLIKSWRTHSQTIYNVLPFFLLFPVYPLTDIITTSSEKAPYAVAVFPTLTLSVIFICAFFLHEIKKCFPRYSSVITGLFFLVLLVETMFFFQNYLHYPKYSSDYWGWQWGPKAIISYFQSQQHMYDELYMTGYFNEPAIFLAFYDPQKYCKNCFIGGFTNAQPAKKQLFAIRVHELEEANSTYKHDFAIKKVLYLPNGKPEYYIGEFRQR